MKGAERVVRKITPIRKEKGRLAAPFMLILPSTTQQSLYLTIFTALITTGVTGTSENPCCTLV